MISLDIFTSEAELREYARINGYDEGAINTLVKEWEEYSENTEESVEVSHNKKPKKPLWR